MKKVAFFNEKMPIILSYKENMCLTLKKHDMVFSFLKGFFLKPKKGTTKSLLNKYLK